MNMNLKTIVAAVAIAVAATVTATISTATATAAPVKVRTVPTTINAPKLAVVGSTIKVRGKTSKRWRRVVLQRKNIWGEWKRVKTTRSKRGKFVFKVKVRKNTNEFRVVSKRRVIRKKHRRIVFRQMASNTRRVQTYVVEEPPGPPVPVEDPPEGESNPNAIAATLTLLAINKHRSEMGLDRYARNECLAEFAEAHSRRMVEYNKFAHSPDQFFVDKGYETVHTACEEEPEGRDEILALVGGDTPAEAAQRAMNVWLNSPIHREVVESTFGSNRQMGVGVVQTTDGSWWVTAVGAFNWDD